MGIVTFKTDDSDVSLITEVPDCLELMIDKTGTIYTPNLDDISELYKDEFKQMCKMLAQAALLEMESPRILH